MIHRFMELMEVGVDWVLYLLIALSIVMVALAIERAIILVKRKGRLSQLQRLVQQLLEGDSNAEELIREDSSVTALIAWGLLRHREMSPEALQEIADGLMIEQRARLEKRLGYFATLGSNAPFIGLFGTVLGIVKAFADLAQADVTGPQVVMAGISEALVATAVGIGVAIPCLVLFNVFKGRVRDTMRDAEVLVKMIMAHRMECAVTSLMQKTEPETSGPSRPKGGNSWQQNCRTTTK